MTLDEKIVLIDQLAKENKGHTIKDYLELVAELDQIQASYGKTNSIPQRVRMDGPAWTRPNHPADKFHHRR